jgi:hypothetical protein
MYAADEDILNPRNPQRQRRPIATLCNQSFFTHFHAISFAVLVFSQPFYIFDTINFATVLEVDYCGP